jgi:polyisoprenoid-binding protein YceI
MDQNETGVVCYRVDAKQGRFVVQAFSEGLLSAFGHNPTIAIRDVSGRICFRPETFAEASIELSVKADSLSVTDNISDKDRAEMERTMREEVLETARYPEVTYRSTSVSANRIFEGMYRIRMLGELSLHGVTREQPIEGQLTVSTDSIRASGECRLKQSDHKIKRVSVAGGTLKVKDEVKLSFEIVARKEA